MNYALRTDYESEELQLLGKFIDPTDKVLEVGAGIGFLSLYCLMKKGVSDYVVIEANPELLDIIRKNYQLNGLEIGQVTLLNKVFQGTATSGDTSFFIARDFWSSSTEKRDCAGYYANIPGVTLEQVEQYITFRPNTLIMDIEGGEKNVPIDVYTQFEKIFIELHPHIISSKKSLNIYTRIIINYTYIMGKQTL